MEPGTSEFNPYAPPSPVADTAFADRLGAEHEAPLATLWQRWLGALIDNLVAGSLMISAAFGGGIIGAAARPLGESDEEIGFVAIGLMGAAFVAYLVLQSMLITKSGQSVGKRVVKTRIVLQSGELPGFWHGVVLRTWLSSALGFIPLFGSVVTLIDTLMVFRADRRMLHDHIAGTSVIQA